MAYVDPNFKTKKELKEAVKNGDLVMVFSPGIFPCTRNGREYVEGPHYPKPHTWYVPGVRLRMVRCRESSREWR